MKEKTFRLFVNTYKAMPSCLSRSVMKLVHAYLMSKPISFDVNLVEHCNLNCCGCDNYSPLACEEYIDIHIFQRDLRQMFHIFGGKIGEVRLMGGEPLLHPDIAQLIRTARECLPGVKIFIITNGTKIKEMDDDFFAACVDSDVSVYMTKYPINIDYDSIEEFLKSKHVKTDFFSREELKTLYRKPLDLEGKQNYRKSFDLCLNANRCVALKKGKLYTCTTLPTLCHFNKYFGKNLSVTDEDGIDIYQVTDAKEIRKFLASPVSACRYCKSADEEFWIPWTTSKRDIHEWAD